MLGHSLFIIITTLKRLSETSKYPKRQRLLITIYQNNHSIRRGGI